MAFDATPEDERQWQAKLNETASTLMDRKVILDALYKLLRLKQDRQTDIATAVAVVGTCLDMCPEHERYFRIETNCVSPFELDANGVPDQTIMVKEYRRSGADQKDPLPDELRPISVLQRTMNYLCFQIIDQDPVSTGTNAGEWFDFTWGRTRSIRKDITQQHLINPESVDLIEKCARFHIYCAYYLCEEGVHDFDPKINNENLHNCLQTLKEFYFELGTRSIYCTNEEEFRSYDVLLNLGNEETLSELKHYRKTIRDSPSIRFAVKMYQAYHSKNHIKFFQLARQANFFMSCILSGYFNQFRIDILNNLRRAFTTPKSTKLVPYPTHSIIQQFGFDDNNELASFCEQIDLRYDNESIYFRSGPQLVPTNIKKRSQLLVQSKLGTSAGRAILSDSSQLEILPIHSSFDANNRLIVDRSALMSATTVTPQKKETISVPKTVPAQPVPSFSEIKGTSSFANTDSSGFNLPSLFGNTAKPPSEKPPPPAYPKFNNSSFSFVNQVEKLSSKETKLEVNPTPLGSNGGFFKTPNLPTSSSASVDFTFNLKNKTLTSNESHDLFSAKMAFPTPVQQPAPPFPEALSIDLDAVFDGLLSIIIKEECHSSLKQLKERQKLIVEKASQLFDHLLDSIIRDTASETIHGAKKLKEKVDTCSAVILEQLLDEIVTTTIKESYIELISSRRKKQAAALSDHLFRVLIDCLLQELSSQVLASETEYRDCQITQWRNLTVQGKYWAKWRKFYLARKKYKFYRDNFPAAPLPVFSRPVSNTNSAFGSGVGGLALGLGIPSRTVIDDSFKKANSALRRKLVYSKFASPSALNQYVKEKLTNKIASNAVNGHRAAQLEQMKRAHYLEEKYFKLWFRKVRLRKRNFIRSQFPSAPAPPMGLKPGPGLDRFAHQLTLIDAPIAKASASIKENLLKKLHYDYDSTMNLAKRKLEQREQMRNISRQSVHPSDEVTVFSDNDNYEPLRKRFGFVPFSKQISSP